MNINYSTEINAPSNVLWTWLDDSEKIKLWMKGVEDDVPTSDGPRRVGSTFRMKIREGRKVTEYDGTITAYEPCRYLAIDMVGGCMGPMTMHVDYRLEEVGAGRTRLDYSCRASDVPALWRALGLLFRPMVKMQLKGFMRTLKMRAEEEANAVTA